MEIYWDGTDRLPDGLLEILTEAICLGLTRAGKPGNCEISVTLVGSEEIKKLNRDYRKMDTETDVLSFPVPFDGSAALGDIAVCVPVAKAQAEAYGHSFEREMAFLTAHGLLHLLGYGHESEAGEREMIREQNEILDALGIIR